MRTDQRDPVDASPSRELTDKRIQETQFLVPCTREHRASPYYRSNKTTTSDVAAGVHDTGSKGDTV